MIVSCPQLPCKLRVIVYQAMNSKITIIFEILWGLVIVLSLSAIRNRGYIQGSSGVKCYRATCASWTGLFIPIASKKPGLPVAIM